jgi:hypothetical protein
LERSPMAQARHSSPRHFPFPFPWFPGYGILLNGCISILGHHPRLASTIRLHSFSTFCVLFLFYSFFVPFCSFLYSHSIQSIATWYRTTTDWERTDARLYNPGRLLRHRTVRCKEQKAKSLHPVILCVALCIACR